MRRDDEQHPLMLPCDNARSLVPSYLDGELTEAQASPLRNHLIDCPSCREVAKEGKNLRRWFEADAANGDSSGEDGEPAFRIPDGFAARVARRAFAGDPGLLVPAPPVPARREVLPFVLAMTATAAALLFFFALQIQRASLPAKGPLSADDYRPPWEAPAEVGAPEAPGTPTERIDRPAEERWNPEALIQPRPGASADEASPDTGKPEGPEQADSSASDG